MVNKLIELQIVESMAILINLPIYKKKYSGFDIPYVTRKRYVTKILYSKNKI